MNKCISISMLFATAFSAIAATNTWKSAPGIDYSQWKNPNNYEEGTIPKANDTVILPANGATVYLSDSNLESFELASSLAHIRPAHTFAATGKVVITISDTSAVRKFNSPITFHLTQDSALQPIIVKKGAGTLELANASKNRAYHADIFVDEGTLMLPQSGSDLNISLGDISVSNNATLFTATCGFTTCANPRGVIRRPPRPSPPSIGRSKPTHQSRASLHPFDQQVGRGFFFQQIHQVFFG